MSRVTSFVALMLITETISDSYSKSFHGLSVNYINRFIRILISTWKSFMLVYFLSNLAYKLIVLTL